MVPKTLPTIWHTYEKLVTKYHISATNNMISVTSEKKISTAKKRDIAPFKVNGQSHIILQRHSNRFE
jgi:hypothetical protein